LRHIDLLFHAYGAMGKWRSPLPIRYCSKETVCWWLPPRLRKNPCVSFSVKRKRWIGIKRISTGMPSIASWFPSVLSWAVRRSMERNWDPYVCVIIMVSISPVYIGLGYSCWQLPSWYCNWEINWPLWGKLLLSAMWRKCWETVLLVLKNRIWSPYLWGLCWVWLSGLFPFLSPESVSLSVWE